MVGKLHDGCLGVVVEKTVFFSLVLLLVNVLKNIVVDGFCFDNGTIIFRIHNSRVVEQNVIYNIVYILLILIL